MERQIAWERAAAKIFCIASALGIMWVVLRFAGEFIVAALLSACIAYFINRGASLLSDKLKIPKKLCAAFLLLILLIVGVSVGIFAALRIYRELEGVAVWISDNRARIILTLTETIEKLENRAGSFFINEYETVKMEDMIYSVANKILSVALSGVGKALAGIGKATPKAFLGAVVFIISTAHLSVDGDRIVSEVRKIIPKNYLPILDRLRGRLVGGLRQYIKAYAILFLMTFCELLAGLLILRAPYPFLVSLMVAAVDILPVVGAGAVLLPWAAISLLVGNSSFGLGLFVLYGITVVVRQIAEPHIVGEKMGIHPAVSLLLMFIGFCFFGPVGAVLSPFAVLLFKEIQR